MAKKKIKAPGAPPAPPKWNEIRRWLETEDGRVYTLHEGHLWEFIRGDGPLKDAYLQLMEEPS